jgi:hypothetical protein
MEIEIKKEALAQEFVDLQITQRLAVIDSAIAELQTELDEILGLPRGEQDANRISELETSIASRNEERAVMERRTLSDLINELLAKEAVNFVSSKEHKVADTDADTARRRADSAVTTYKNLWK